MKNFPLIMCAVVLIGVMSVSAANFEPQAKPKKDDKAADKDKSKDKDKDKAKSDAKSDEDTPKPLFQGNLGIKSSRQGKDSAALGFNGIGPDGQVEKAALNAAPTKVDGLKAAALVAYNPVPEELNKFMGEGSLKAGTPPTESTDTKDKKKKR
jgi:hypothetical protein